MQQLGYTFSSHSIEFKPNGTLVMVNIPAKWIFPQKQNTLNFYSGNGTWTLSNQPVTNMGYIQPLVNTSNPSENNLTIRFGTILDDLYFYPDNKPTDVNRIRFQKCFPSLHFTDQSLVPLIKALNESKRDTFGFSPLTSKDRIVIDGTIGNAEIWLHAYNDFSSHDISFKSIKNNYIWVFEQENFRGPDRWVASDAASEQESITVQYQTENINGGPVNGLMINYTGRNPSLTKLSQNWRNVSDASSTLEEWRRWRASEAPSSQSLCP